MESMVKFTSSELDDQEIFSFNSSYCQLFSSDDDDEADGDDSYIEIALEPAQTPSPQMQGNRDDQELEFRISFSATSTTTYCSSMETSSGEESYEYPPNDSEFGLMDIKNANKRGVLQLPFINRLLNRLPSAMKLKSSSLVAANHEKSRPRDGQHTMNNKLNLDLIKNRNAWKTPSATEGRIMNFLVKFRSINFRRMLTSLVVNFRQVSGATLLNRQSLINTAAAINGEKSTVIRINLDRIKRTFSYAARVDATIKASREAKCSPSSIKSSPITRGDGSERSSNHYATENSVSVQAAIAHCNKSFGREDDFHFWKLPS